MISYAKQLKLALKHNINASSLMVAVEVNFQLSILRQLLVSGDLFETYCDFVEEAFYANNADLTISAIASALGALIDENAEITVDTLIQRAYDYI